MSQRLVATDPDSGPTAGPYGWDWLVVGLIPLVLAGLAVHGLTSGDPSEAEARRLLATRVPAGFVVPELPGALLGPHRSLVWSRGVASIAVLGAAAALVVGLRCRFGLQTALVAGLGWAMTPAMLLYAPRSCPDALLGAMLALLLGSGVVAGGKRRGRGTVLGAAALLAMGLGIGGVLILGPGGGLSLAGPETAPPRALALLWIALATFPWGVLALTTLRPAFWRSASAEGKRLAAWGGLGSALAVGVTACLPERWVLGAALASSGTALLLASGWDSARATQRAAAFRWHYRRGLSFVVLLAPLTVVVWAFGHLLGTYQSLERAAVVAVMGTVSIGFAWGGAHLVPGVRLARLLPILLAAVAMDIAYVWVIFPEEGLRNGERPYAHALQAVVPEDAIVVTDLPMTDTFRFYLERPVTTVGQQGRVRCGVLVAPVRPDSPSDPLAVLEDRGGQALGVWPLRR